MCSSIIDSSHTVFQIICWWMTALNAWVHSLPQFEDPQPEAYEKRAYRLQTSEQLRWYNKITVARLLHYVTEYWDSWRKGIPLLSYACHGIVYPSSAVFPLSLILIRHPTRATKLNVLPSIALELFGNVSLCTVRRYPLLRPKLTRENADSLLNAARKGYKYEFVNCVRQTQLLKKSYHLSTGHYSRWLEPVRRWRIKGHATNWRQGPTDRVALLLFSTIWWPPTGRPSQT